MRACVWMSYVQEAFAKLGVPDKVGLSTFRPALVLGVGIGALARLALRARQRLAVLLCPRGERPQQSNVDTSK